MKTLSYLFVMVILVIAGCAKDDTMFETQDNLELKKAKVPIPIKGDFYTVPDMESFLVVPLPPPYEGSVYIGSRSFVSGTCSHIGRVDAKKSYSEIKEMEIFLDENGDFFSIQSGNSFIVAANGDSFKTTFTTTQLWVDGSFVGKEEIIPGSGTGRFKGVSGSFDNVGGWYKDGFWIKAQGFLVYK